MGSQAGQSAFTLAEKYWSGCIFSESLSPAVTLGGGQATLRWTAVRGMYQKVQVSSDLMTWTDATAAAQTYDTNGSWTDTSPAPGCKFYRVVWSAAP